MVVGLAGYRPAHWDVRYAPAAVFPVSQLHVQAPRSSARKVVCLFTVTLLLGFTYFWHLPTPSTIQPEIAGPESASLKDSLPAVQQELTPTLPLAARPHDTALFAAAPRAAKGTKKRSGRLRGAASAEDVEERQWTQLRAQVVEEFQHAFE